MKCVCRCWDGLQFVRIREIVSTAQPANIGFTSWTGGSWNFELIFDRSIAGVSEAGACMPGEGFVCLCVCLRTLVGSAIQHIQTSSPAGATGAPHPSPAPRPSHTATHPDHIVEFNPPQGTLGPLFSNRSSTAAHTLAPVPPHHTTLVYLGRCDTVAACHP